MEAWGFTVNLIGQTASQVEFDAEFADHDVAYVSAEIDDTLLSTKVVNTTIGVVNENKDQAETLGFVDDISEDSNRLGLYVLDNTHYVTSPFSLGVLFLYSDYEKELYLDGVLAPGIQALGHESNSAFSAPTLAVLAAGASATAGRTAAGRRVQLPWSDEGLDWNHMTDDAKTIMKRAIEWAADKEEP